jgi:hypothetical protein
MCDANTIIIEEVIEPKTLIISDDCSETTIVIDEVIEPVTIEICDLGAEGLSAYQIALKNGFVGTEAQWLESLKSITTLVTSGFGENVAYNATTQTLTIDKYNWVDLARGYKVIPTLFSTNSTGTIYEYIYQTQTLYRYIATDLSQDAFYDDDTLSNRLCTKKISL